MATTAPLLDLVTIAPQYTIIIDGVSYFIRHTDALTLRQSLIADRAIPRIAELLKTDLTEEEDRELSGLLQQVCQVVLDAPLDVQARLTDVQKLQVFVAFTPLRSKLTPSVIGANAATAASPDGSNGSRGSKRTTAARRRAGTTGSPAD
jgi:hypothetical protein